MCPIECDKRYWNLTVTYGSFDGNRGYRQTCYRQNGVTVMPLTDTGIKNAKPTDKPLKLADGGGLYLLLNPNGSLRGQHIALSSVADLAAHGVVC